MIQTKEDLAYYLSQDRKALGIANDGFVQRLRLLGYGAFKSHLGRLSIIIMHALEISYFSLSLSPLQQSSEVRMRKWPHTGYLYSE